MQTQGDPAWLDFVVLLERERVVVQDTLYCGPQSTAASDTTRGHGIFKIFILSAALAGVGKGYQMTKAVMEAYLCGCHKSLLLLPSLCSNGRTA